MTSLEAYLEDWAGGRRARRDVAVTVAAIARAAATLSGLVAQGPLAGAMGAVIGASSDGDGQKLLDLRAHALFLDALTAVPAVGAIASEESLAPVVLCEGAPIAVALDPLDGSNNVELNAPLGVVFALLPATGYGDARDPFLQPGHRQLAAGFVVFGPHTALMLTLGEGVAMFTLEPASGEFRLTRNGMRIPPSAREYAINAANRRHWHPPVRAFVDECLAGAEGPRGANFNTRWLGCVVAEAFRILTRGGVYLYPGDARDGYRRGRLRLVYEANPLALLTEQAGGAATDGFERILDLVPDALHQRVPLIFGAREEVARIMALHMEGMPQRGGAPLFAQRGLFRA